MGHHGSEEPKPQLEHEGENLPDIPVSSLAMRIHGWSWQAFPIGMGTGAVYVVLSGLQPDLRLSGMVTLETIFFFLNMAFFLFNTTTLLIQAIVYPRQSLRLIQDPVKGIFVPLIVLSFATIIIGTINYAVPTGHVSPNLIYALFWVYTFFAVVTSFTMLMIWFNNAHDLNHFTPAYAFLIFPMMLIGVVGLNVLDPKVINPAEDRAIGVLFTAYFFQGLGFFMTFIYIIIYIIRIMTTGFLDGHQANGAFVACGPPGFTALALVKLGKSARAIIPAHPQLQAVLPANTGEIWYASSLIGALVLFGLAIFLFIFGILPYWFKVHKHLADILGCWALTFPNVGWIATLRVLGDALNIKFFYILHAIFAFLMLAVWCVLIILTGYAIWKGVILKSKPEDVIRDTRVYNPNELKRTYSKASSSSSHV